MKQQNEDKLRNLFQEMTTEDASLGFENRLMHQIGVVVERKKKRDRLYNILWLSIGVLAITVFVILSLQYMNITMDFPQFTKIEFKEMGNIFSSVNFSSSLIIFAGIILVMLMGDTLIRKRIEEKNKTRRNK